jgi:hypothetical protein
MSQNYTKRLCVILYMQVSLDRGIIAGVSQRFNSVVSLRGFTRLVYAYSGGSVYILRSNSRCPEPCEILIFR